MAVYGRWSLKGGGGGGGGANDITYKDRASRIRLSVNFIYGSGHKGAPVLIATLFCYQRIAKPDKKTSPPSWPDSYIRGSTVPGIFHASSLIVEI